MKLNLSSCWLACIVCMLTLEMGGRGDEKTPVPGVTHVNATEAANLVAKKEVVVLDVRSPEEFSAGHISGATNIDFLENDFAERLAKLDREKTYLVHCAAGGRSTKSLPKFSNLGFKHIVHLDGGLKAWEAAGNPVTTK